MNFPGSFLHYIFDGFFSIGELSKSVIKHTRISRLYCRVHYRFHRSPCFFFEGGECVTRKLYTTYQEGIVRGCSLLKNWWVVGGSNDVEDNRAITEEDPCFVSVFRVINRYILELSSLAI